MGAVETITFPDRPAAWYDIELHTITFPVVVDDHRMACVVSVSSLMNRFTDRAQFTPLEARAVYEEHKDNLRRLVEADIRGRSSLENCEELTITLLDHDCGS
jgi:hypothetical protein